jgi:hypothetical protein
MTFLRSWPRTVRALADFNAELEQFAMDVGRAPKRIGAAHLTNQIADFGGYLRLSMANS